MSDALRSLREELEARVLAHFHGELSEEDVAALERVLANDPELQAYRDRMVGLCEELTDVLKMPDGEAASWQIDEHRRRMFAATAEGTGVLRNDGRSRKAGLLKLFSPAYLVRAVAVLVFVAVTAAILVPSVGSDSSPRRPAGETVGNQSEPSSAPPPAAPPSAQPRVGVGASAAAEPVAMSSRESSAPGARRQITTRGPEMPDNSPYANAFAGEVPSEPSAEADLVGGTAPKMRDEAVGRETAPSRAELLDGVSVFWQRAKVFNLQVDHEEQAFAEQEAVATSAPGREDRSQIATLPQRAEQPLVEGVTEIDPFSTFSLNISDVSFRLAMAALQRGQAPARAAIRSEEFVNAFDYRDPPPEPGEAVALHWETARVPWLHDRWLVRFSVAAGETGRPPEEPLNLTVLLDNSGSMKRADRQEIVAASVNALAPLVRPQDRLNAVTFARRPQLVAENFAGSEAPRFVERLLKQVPEGGTNLEAALDLAYAVTARNRVAGQNRIVLLTDGAANLGNVEPERLRDMAVEGRQQAIALDAFGVGWEGYEDATLEALTRNSDGRYAFLTDSLHARRDFAERLAGALQVAAKNVKVQIEWNPDRVTRFRQIGYERHRLATEDFRNNTVDAAEIARAESGTALYVIEVDEAGIGPLGTLRVRYQEPASGLYREREWTLMPPRRVPPLDEASPAIRLAATAAFFAEKLAGLPSASAYDLRDLDELATGLSTSFDSPQVQQLINALRRARLLNGE